MLQRLGRRSACFQLSHWVPVTIKTVRSLTSCVSTQSSQPKTFDCNDESLYSHSAQRWLWNEPQQLRRRYLKFDANALIQVAEEVVGNGAVCARFSKLAEGNTNKAFLVVVQDGSEVVVKIPNPNAGPSHHTTASEVATMQYVRENLQIPVPKVLSYCSHASKSRLGTEYIIMEKAPGVELSRKWDSLKARDKLSIVEQLGSISSTLSKAEFSCYGALYRQEDVSSLESIKVDDTYAMGTVTSRAWFEDRRGEVDVYRGPWTSPADVIKDMAEREKACVKKFNTFPRDGQGGIYNIPGSYHPTKEAKLSALDDFLKMFRHILPISDLLSVGILWHGDLHSDNIFVDSDDPTKITSIIDWQAVSVYPKFLVARHPPLLEFDGPKPEQFVVPALPENIQDLEEKEKKAAKKLHLAQVLWNYYELQVHKQSAGLIRVFEYQDSLQAELLGLIGAIFDDGEPYIQRLLSIATRDDVWPKIVGEDDNGNPKVPCPLHYTESELETQDEEHDKWERGIEMKHEILGDIGLNTGWDGAITPDEYDDVVRRLDLAKKKFLDRNSATPEERSSWEKVWPFQDKVGL